MKITVRNALLASLLFCTSAFAQTSGVPSSMSYQAIVTDDTGALLAPTTPVSYEIIIRIFDMATGGTKLWSESHVTEVHQGRFAIILGDGQPIPISASEDEPRPDLADVFTESGRFVEITATANDVANAPSKTLAPRQRLVATATAMRARYAEKLGKGANTALTVLDDGKIGIGTTSPAVPLQVAGTISARPVDTNHGYVTLNPGSANTAGFIGFFENGGSRMGYMGYETNDLRLQLEGGHPYAIMGGNVGIGVTSPTQRLDVAGNGQFSGGTQIGYAAQGLFGDGVDIAIRQFNRSDSGIYFQKYGGSSSHMSILNNGRVGIGIHPRATLDVHGSGGDTALFQQPGDTWASYIHTGGNGDIFWRSRNGSGRVILQDTGGNVGIGHAAPEVRLDVNGAIRARGGVVRPQVGVNGGSGQRLVLYPGNATSVPFGMGIQGAAMWSAVPTNGHHLWYENTTERMRIMPGGAVGIGTTGPGDKLDVNGVIRGHGFRCRSAQNGTVSGHVFNFGWSGANMAAYIDASFVGWVGGTSDRRLKEKIQPMKGGAIERVMALKPASFKYKNIPGTIFTGDDQMKEGFIADELQLVVPSAVTGKKNAVSEDGKIQPQVISDTPIIALLTKAVQEQQQTIQKQQDEIDALKVAAAKIGSPEGEEDEVAALKRQLQAMDAKMTMILSRFSEGGTTVISAPSSKASQSVTN
jgi:hypothetical protein